MDKRIIQLYHNQRALLFVAPMPNNELPRYVIWQGREHVRSTVDVATGVEHYVLSSDRTVRSEHDPAAVVLSFDDLVHRDNRSVPDAEFSTVVVALSRLHAGKLDEAIKLLSDYLSDVQRVVPRRDLSLRELQTQLPWTVHYHRDFRANPMTHKDFGHALLHVTKACGKLATVVNDAEHGGSEFPAQDVDRYVADLVVCALRMANTCPGRTIDLQRAVEDRIETKNQAELRREPQ